MLIWPGRDRRWRAEEGPGAAQRLPGAAACTCSKASALSTCREYVFWRDRCRRDVWRGIGDVKADVEARQGGLRGGEHPPV